MKTQPQPEAERGGSLPRMVRWRLCAKELPKVITEKDGSVNSVLVYKKNGFECGSDIQVSNTVFLRKHRNWVTHWMPLPEPPNNKVSDELRAMRR